MNSTITIELFGSYGARHTPSETQVDFTKHKFPKDPIGPLCRKLVKEGVCTPEDRVHILRDGLPVFKEDQKLSAWADYTIIEGDKGIRRIKYVPIGAPVAQGEPKAGAVGNHTRHALGDVQL